MTKIIVTQIDTRNNIKYLNLTKSWNQSALELIQTNQSKNSYSYSFIKMKKKYYSNMHPSMGKINFLNELLHTTPNDVVVFLDSDAWINEPTHLQELIQILVENQNIHGCFSRDPYLQKNDYINSGSFILKVNKFNKKIYQKIIFYTKIDDSHHNFWSYDQYYISKIIYDNRENFMVFKPEVLNTPSGKILRHNWLKDKKMYDELYKLLDVSNEYATPEPFDFDKEIDQNFWPNTSDE